MAAAAAGRAPPAGPFGLVITFTPWAAATADDDVAINLLNDAELNAMISISAEARAGEQATTCANPRDTASRVRVARAGVNV